MRKPSSYVSADYNEPILFRTSDSKVYDASITTGSLWLRSDQYFRELEDEVRRDEKEGVNVGKITVPLNLKAPNGSSYFVCGDGSIGQQITPHYILSLHGSSISKAQLHSFGGCTFGIKSITKLSAEVLYRSSKILKSTGYRFGAVSYQYTALVLSHSQVGGAAMSIDGVPPTFLNPINTDVLRKQPTLPFIEQDEWRIVVFTEGYLRDDPLAPLEINVEPSQFYGYQIHNVEANYGDSLLNFSAFSPSFP